MQLIPICSSPLIRVHYETSICELSPNRREDLKLRVKLPADFKSNHLVMVLKLKQGNTFIGPTFLLCTKIITKQRVSHEVSAFDSSIEDEMKNLSTIEKQLKQISQGKDVYTEQQLLGMASVLSDEGFGNYDRCLMVLRALRGDIDYARKTLSQITFSEAQYS